MRNQKSADEVLVWLTFDNKAALVPLVVLVVMWVAEPSQTGVLRSAWLVVRRWWWLWLGYMLLLGGWLAAYLGLSEPAIRNVSDSPEVVRTAVITFVEGLIPSLAGGPVVWASVPGSGGAYAAPPTWFTFSTTVSASQSTRISFTSWMFPEDSPFFHSLPRERDQ